MIVLIIRVDCCYGISSTGFNYYIFLGDKCTLEVCSLSSKGLHPLEKTNHISSCCININSTHNERWGTKGGEDSCFHCTGKAWSLRGRIWVKLSSLHTASCDWKGAGTLLPLSPLFFAEMWAKSLSDAGKFLPRGRDELILT